jgi:hypothetical protein
MQKMAVPDSGVNVRMYNPGFGDCFLLAFRDRQNKPFYMLIDCGVHGQYKGGGARVQKVVKDIRDATDGHLHVVVVTHEHADHVSGFYSGRDVFQSDDAKKKLHVDEVWFAWTEDPRSELAQKLDKKRALMFRGLRAAENSLAARGAAEQAANLRHMLGFYEIDGMGLATRDARDLIRDQARKRVRYLKPKQPPLQLPEVEGVRIFVLGPPVDERLLLAADPTGRPGEVYEHQEREDPDEALAGALVVAAGEGEGADFARAELAQPFAGNHRISVDTVKANKPRRNRKTTGFDKFGFFHGQYGFAEQDEHAWRRIDDRWQGASESLALKLDSATNNTSLVLAIELMGQGKVLLFPGDAQVGNWRSWHEGGWSHKNGLARGEEITAEDLLRRTVLYKVGHHGSHNATLREQGLEMMTSEQLTAMIPVDEPWARDRKPHAWKMPFGPMYEDLLARTQGRILRTDVGLVKPEETTDAWRQFEKDTDVVKETEGSNRVRFVQLKIPD